MKYIKGVLVLYLFIALLFIINNVDAACVLRLSTTTNSHAATCDYTAYGTVISSSSVSTDTTPSSLSSSGCPSGQVAVVRLTGATNAHLEAPSGSTAGYSNLCVALTSGSTGSCSYSSTACSSGTCLVRLSSSTNAHGATCTDTSTPSSYGYICCSFTSSSTTSPTAPTCSGTTQSQCDSSGTNCYWSTSNTCATLSTTTTCSDLSNDPTFCNSATLGCTYDTTTNTCAAKTTTTQLAGIGASCTQNSDCQSGYCDNSNPGSPVCNTLPCASYGGTICSSNQQCYDTTSTSSAPTPLSFVSGASDTQRCCVNTTSNQVASCTVVQTTLSGTTQYSIDTTPCQNPDANGVGKKTVCTYASGQSSGGCPEGTTTDSSGRCCQTVDCYVVPAKKVPAFTLFNIIISLIIIIGFYALRNRKV